MSSGRSNCLLWKSIVLLLRLLEPGIRTRAYAFLRASYFLVHLVYSSQRLPSRTETDSITSFQNLLQLLPLPILFFPYLAPPPTSPVDFSQDSPSHAILRPPQLSSGGGGGFGRSAAPSRHRGAGADDEPQRDGGVRHDDGRRGRVRAQRVRGVAQQRPGRPGPRLEPAVPGHQRALAHLAGRVLRRRGRAVPAVRRRVPRLGRQVRHRPGRAGFHRHAGVQLQQRRGGAYAGAGECRCSFPFLSFPFPSLPFPFVLCFLLSPSQGNTR